MADLYRLKLGNREFVGFLLPGSERKVGSGGRITLGTFTALIPDPRVMTGIRIVKSTRAFQDRCAIEAG